MTFSRSLNQSLFCRQCLVRGLWGLLKAYGARGCVPNTAQPLGRRTWVVGAAMASPGRHHPSGLWAACLCASRRVVPGAVPCAFGGSVYGNARAAIPASEECYSNLQFQVHARNCSTITLQRPSWKEAVPFDQQNNILASAICLMQECGRKLRR